MTVKKQVSFKILFLIFSLAIYVGCEKIEAQIPSMLKVNKDVEIFGQKFIEHERRLQTIQIDQSTNKPIDKQLQGVFVNKMLSNSLFRDLILNHEIPTVLSKNEIFSVKGTVKNYVSGYVTFIFRNIKTFQQTKFQTKLQNGKSSFEISLDLNRLEQGSYRLAGFSGYQYYYENQIYTVIKIDQDKNYDRSGLITQDFKIIFEDNKLFLTWKQNSSAALHKITFSQQNADKQYYLSNFHTKFQVPFQDFASFTQSPVYVNISSAYSGSRSLSGRLSQFSNPLRLQFTPMHHHFAEFKSDQIKLNQEIPWRIKVGQSIVINGSALVNLDNKIIVQEPTKTFGLYYFNDSVKGTPVKTGTEVYKRISFDKPGVYILEVNNMGGSAAINRPVYVGQGYPLLPDFQDLSPEHQNLLTIANAQPKTLQQKRNLLLSLINQKRIQFGLNPVTADSELDRLAQYHSDDMVRRNFFGHYSPEGQGPQQRATRLGINRGVGQNAAVNMNLTEGHLRLCRSPAHLMNIVNKDWINVGLGITADSQNYLYIVEEFAARDYLVDPLTNQEIEKYKNQIISYLKQKYPSIESQNKNLSESLSSWQNLSDSQQNSQSIFTFLRTKGIFGASIGNIRVYFNSNFVDNLKSTSYLDTTKPNPKQFGLGLKLNKGWMEIFVSYI